MKKTVLTLLCVCLALGLLAGCGETERAPERTLYKIDAALDPGSMRLTMDETVTFQNTGDGPWEKICLRNYAWSCLENGAPIIGEIAYDENGNALEDPNDPAAAAWEDIRAEFSSGVTSAADASTGEALTVRAEEGDPSIVWVELSKPLKAGEWTSVSLRFETDIFDCGQRFGAGYVQGTATGETEAPEGAGRTFQLGQFYPVLCVWEDGDFVRHPWVDTPECFYSDMADYDVTLTLPGDYLVASTGSETCGEGPEGAAVWSLEARNVRDFAIVASNEYAQPLTGEAQGVEVRIFCPDSFECFQLERELALETAKDAVTAYTEAYGPLPYDQVDVCVVNFDSGGMEYPGLVFVASQDCVWLPDTPPEGYYVPDLEEYVGLREERWTAARTDVAHEVGHQWFYAVVGNDEYRYPFIDESFTAFSEIVYTAHVKGWDEATAKADAWAENLNGGIRSAGASCGDEGFTPSNAYDYGKLFLYRLMELMGRDSFFSMMSQWYTDNQFRFATNAQFLDFARDRAGEGAEGLIREFFF